MPDALKAVAADRGVLVSAEGVSVKASGRSVRLPGVRSGRSVSLLAGSLVVLPRRALASVGRYPILDTDFSGVAADGQSLSFAPDGVRIKIDVQSLVEGGSGTVELHFREPLDGTVLAQLPSTTCPVQLSNTVAAMIRGWV